MQLCSEPGCDGPDRVTCDYRDRRGTPCPTAWCPQHIVKVNAWHLCRRHARIVQSLAPVEFRGELPAPDLDNRAPSLASYLADTLDKPMRTLLSELARPALGEYVAAEALNLVTSVSGGRRWSQGWKLFDNTGPLLRIGVEVDEKRDPECGVRLNSRVVLRFVPPWIRERSAAAPFPRGGRGRAAPGLLRDPHGAARPAGGGRRGALGPSLGALSPGRGPELTGVRS